MNSSLRPISRRAALGALASLAGLAPVSAHAQNAPLAGHWQTMVGPVLVDIIIQADGQYGSSARLNGNMTMQRGHVVRAGDILRFIVEDYQPRTQVMVGANNTRYTTNLAQPPNSNDRIVSLTATTLVLYDLDDHSQITLQRVG